MPGTTCAKAISMWSEKNDSANAEEAPVVGLICISPPIEKMDSSLNTLVAAKKLSLSTNCIDKMISLPNLKNLEILSLGRNLIKKISGLEEVGATLKELWISYNQISTLDGLHPCVKLETLFISNNKINNWDELGKLTQLPALINVLLIGNPIYDGFSRAECAPHVLRRLPNLKTLDGAMVTADSMVDTLLASCKTKLLEAFGSADEAFKAIDMDHSQGLELTEFKKCINDLKGVSFTSEELAELFTHVDLDKSGVISIEEFKQAVG
eukprot:GEMP01092269.1.p1 GENE.GEMP01092269.1~~GEMP01092269.1.p1  ORF type:complete len:267 (+),score=49.73 GEMP01092269.1:33-833(+)